MTRERETWGEREREKIRAHNCIPKVLRLNKMVSRDVGEGLVTLRQNSDIVYFSLRTTALLWVMISADNIGKY